jgi:hypothetical protein
MIVALVAALPIAIGRARHRAQVAFVYLYADDGAARAAARDEPRAVVRDHTRCAPRWASASRESSRAKRSQDARIAEGVSVRFTGERLHEGQELFAPRSRAPPRGLRVRARARCGSARARPRLRRRIGRCAARGATASRVLGVDRVAPDAASRRAGTAFCLADLAALPLRRARVRRRREFPGDRAPRPIPPPTCARSASCSRRAAPRCSRPRTASSRTA